MSLAAPALRVRLSRDDLLMRAGVVVLAAVLLLMVGLPLWSLLVKGFEDRDGKFVGELGHGKFLERQPTHF